MEKVLSQIFSAIIFGHLNVAYGGKFYFRQISRCYLERFRVMFTANIKT